MRTKRMKNMALQVLFPPVKGKGIMLEGADKAACEQLVSMLGDKHII